MNNLHYNMKLFLTTDNFFKKVLLKINFQKILLYKRIIIILHL